MRLLMIACAVVVFSGPAFAQKGKAQQGGGSSAYAACVAKQQAAGVPARGAAKKCERISGGTVRR